MQVLLALVDARGSVLTRDDLMQRCWSGQIVGDDSVNRAIKEIRRAARETDGGFGVETIPRVGFRIEGEVCADDSAINLVSGQPQNLSRRQLAAGGLAVAAGGLSYWFWPQSSDVRIEGLLAESEAVARMGSPDADRRAVALLQEAAKQAPSNAKVQGRLALTLARTYEHATELPASSTMEIDSAARRALSLEKDNADALAALAIAVPYYGDWAAAEDRFNAVLTRHPDQLFVSDSLSFLLGAVGRVREGAERRMRFSSAAPLDASLVVRQAYALWFLDRIEESDRTTARGLEIWPRHAGIWFARLWVMASTGRYDRALVHVGDRFARPRLPDEMFITLQSAITAARSRDPAAADAAAQRIVVGVGRSVAAVVNGMMLLNLMQATDWAFKLADAYYLERGPIITAMEWRPGQPVVADQRRRKTNMLFTPTAAAMQRDARFMPLMERMGLANYWRSRGITPDFAKT